MNCKSLANICQRGITAAAGVGSYWKIARSRLRKPNGITSVQMISLTIDTCCLSTDNQSMHTLCLTGEY